MDLYTAVSPSHRELFDRYLKPTARDFNLKVIELEQKGNGEHRNSQWYDALRSKSCAMARAARESEGKIFAWADVDVLILEENLPEWLEAQLGDKEIICQQEAEADMLCTGFLVARGTPAVIRIFEGMGSFPGEHCDQDYFNDHKDELDWGVLPTPEVFTIGHLPSGDRERMSKSGTKWKEVWGELLPKEGMKVFHANYIAGRTYKDMVLDYVKAKYTPQEIKLNIGAGSVEVEGFTPIDRKYGKEAYPLAYEDNSVDEIRASHVLEHFPRDKTMPVLQDWVRTLKPGGKIRIAVPDFEKIVSEFHDHPFFEAYIFGGQTDENDFHHAAFSEDKLRTQMELVGLTDIQKWTSEHNDCAALPVSLNLEGTKADSSPPPVHQGATEIKTRAVMTVPRYGAMASRGLIELALNAHGIPLHTSQGVFWGQCMQRMFNECVRDEIDIILTLDFDTCPTKKMISDLLVTLCSRDDIDCLVALEPRRNNDRPLMTAGKATSIQTNGEPILATTAHFGLTAIRTECLQKVPKPWFFGQPNSQGEWEEDEEKMDPDIWFWHQWRKAGFNIYVDPTIRIGHLEEVVSYFDDDLKVQRCGAPAWRNTFLEG